MGGNSSIQQLTSAHDKAILSGEFELTDRTEQLPPRPMTTAGRPYDEARLLVRIGGEPIGFVTVSLGAVTLSRVAILHAIRRELDAAVKAEVTRQELVGANPINGAGIADISWQELGMEQQQPISVSVVVCTRNRASALPGCLESLKTLRHEALEFIMVDNAPADGSTHELVMRMAKEDSRFQYVRETHQDSPMRVTGGWRTRRTDLAYTDDEFASIRCGSGAAPRVRAPRGRCVTGMVAATACASCRASSVDRRGRPCERSTTQSTGRGPARYSYAGRLSVPGSALAHASTRRRDVLGGLRARAVRTSDLHA